MAHSHTLGYNCVAFCHIEYYEAPSMSTHTPANDARLNFRLPAELKQTIEEAAARTGQSVSDFAVSTLVRTARDVIEQERVTRLSNHDRSVFISLLDDPDARPNEALTAAARKFKKASTTR
jgi:uncharacterized protein (DUF1778 family)